MSNEKKKVKRKSRKKQMRKRGKILVISMAIVIVIVSISVAAYNMKKVTIDIDGDKKIVYTWARDYESLLKEQNIKIQNSDKVSIDLSNSIKRNSEINIKLSKNIHVYVDGQIKSVNTISKDVEELLNELDIKLYDNDKLNKELDYIIQDNDEIRITRVKVEDVEERAEIDFNKKEVKDYKCNIGESRVISQGKKGEKKVSYKITYEDGIEVNRELVGEEIINKPVDEVIGVGIFDSNSITVCVNKERNLSPDYVPQDLVLPNIRMSVSADKLYMRKEAANALEKMFNAAENEGIYLYGVSGYRSYYYQQSIYNPYSGYSAPPGASEHQLGLAMDVNAAYYGSNLITDFGYTEEGIWVEENAHKYGFIIRYLEGKESITGYYYEPWHIRYVGVELATELKNKGITLEEYYGIYD